MENKGYTVTVKVTGDDYPGFLRDVTTVVSNEKMNALAVRSTVDSRKDLCIVELDLLVISIPVLKRTIAKLKELPKVHSAKRL